MKNIFHIWLLRNYEQIYENNNVHIQIINIQP